MSAHGNRRGRLFSVESIAGWVFADMLLVLFLVGLGSAKAYNPPEPPPKVAPIVGMKTDPTSIQIKVDGDALSRGTQLSVQEKAAVCRSIRKGIGKLDGQRAALVLIFGGASDVTEGQNVARAVGSQLGCASTVVFPGKAPNRAFWDGTLPLGSVRMEVFLFITGDRP